MRALLISLCLLAACTPAPTTPPSTSPPSSTTPDPLAARYEVRLGQTLIANVTSVAAAGPDIAILQYQTGGGGGQTQLPGKVGTIDVTLETDWSAAGRAWEDWHMGVAGGKGSSATRQIIEVRITGAAGAATYAYQGCLPVQRRFKLGAQDMRLHETWLARCEGVVRT